MGVLKYRVADVFCGLGGMVLGYHRARTQMAGHEGRFETVLALDAWDVAAESCHRMTGIKVTLADLFTREQYTAYHAERRCWCRPGKARKSRPRTGETLAECHNAPPPWFRELTPNDIRAMCPGGADAIKASPPCKRFSRLLSNAKANSPRYEALNDLVVRWLWLWLEAFPDNPPRLVIMENVPDIADPKRKVKRRGEDLVDRVERMLAAYKYASRRSKFDCGRIANLAQHRDRFLLVARHVPTTRAVLLEPFETPMRTIGQVIGDLPPPIVDEGIPMHVLPTSTDRTRERLAYVTAGADWRSIERNWMSAPGWRWAAAGRFDVLAPSDAAGDIDPRFDRVAFNTVCRLAGWDQQAPCVQGGGGQSNGNVADPRYGKAWPGILGVRTLDDQAPTLSTRSGPTTGAYSVADDRVVGDPRLAPSDDRHTSKFAVRELDGQARTVTGERGYGGGTIADRRVVEEDPRLTCTPNGATLRVVEADGQSPTITATAGVWSTGTVNLADRRPVDDPAINRPMRNGAFGVQEMDGSADTITGVFDIHNGPAAVADEVPRAGAGRIIIAPDWKAWHASGVWRPAAWHRELTPRECADLQSLPRNGADGRPLLLAGNIDEVREQIGNAVPPDSAQVIAELMLGSLMASDLDVSVGGGSGIWVRDDGVLRWHPTSGGAPMITDADLADAPVELVA